MRRAALLAFVVALFFVSSASAEAAWTLRYSTSSTRSNSQPLYYTTIQSPTYIFATSDAPTPVRFFLDGSFVRQESAPYDFAGTAGDGSANPADISPGQHRISASDGAGRWQTAYFTVVSSPSSGASAYFHDTLVGGNGSVDFATQARRDKWIVFHAGEDSATLSAVATAKAANPSVEALDYVNISRVSTWGNSCVTKAQADANGWSTGVNDSDAGGPLAKVWDPGYQQACAAGTLAKLGKGQFDGMFADDFNCACHSAQEEYNYLDRALWRSGMDQLANVVSTALHGRGYSFVPNVGAAGQSNSLSGGWVVTEMTKWADGMMDEFFTVWGGTSYQGYLSKSVAVMDALQNSGVWYLGNAPTTDATVAKYSLALMLLHTKGTASFDAPPNYSSVQWFSFYDTAKALGAATQAPVLSLTGTRYFQHGYVQVTGQGAASIVYTG